MTVPTPASYRLSPEAIGAHKKCMARKEPPQGSNSVGWDKRFTPSVYKEQLCNGTRVEGDLCRVCHSRRESQKRWHGLITEDPPATTHMLGTAWSAKCAWVGGTATVSAVEAVAVVEDRAEAATATATATATVAETATATATAEAVDLVIRERIATAVAVAVPASAAAAAAEGRCFRVEITFRF